MDYTELRKSLLDASDTAARSEILLELDNLVNTSAAERNDLKDKITELDSTITSLTDENKGLVKANSKMFVALGDRGIISTGMGTESKPSVVIPDKPTETKSFDELLSEIDL